MGIDVQSLSLFGRSVWQDDPGEAIFYLNEAYYLVTPGYLAELNIASGKFQYYRFEEAQSIQPVQTNAAFSAQEEKLKAYLQYFNNGLNANQIYTHLHHSKIAEKP